MLWNLLGVMREKEGPRKTEGLLENTLWSIWDNNIVVGKFGL